MLPPYRARSIVAVWGSLHPPLPHCTAQGRCCSPAPKHPRVPELSWVSFPPQFPTMTQKSPSTPALSSRHQLRGFQTAPSLPPSTPTTRDPSTPSLPEKVTSTAVLPFPRHLQPFWAAWGQSCPVINLGCPRDGCWAKSAFIFIPSFSACKDTTGLCLASCEGTCLVWAVPFHNLSPGKRSQGQSCCISPCPNVPRHVPGQGGKLQQP